MKSGGNIFTRWKDLIIRKPRETGEYNRRYNKRERRRAIKETKVEIIDLFKDRGR